ncbi:WAP four-disulfide core domain protein 1 [Rhincodon typus]|uniref:WAP four-disulfide core domain protein 1 n=1 Tax=Rhincodon typus TaxID=259920 RepID=UPI0009A39FDF|nr:WAP four-disulfide core domain protein 1 [Rhincodon typus]XP_048461727.1 WAP four-disulfide core domain protein 1 [Rhincodon typus]
MGRCGSWQGSFLRVLAAVLLCLSALQPSPGFAKSLRVKVADKNDDYEYQLVSYSSPYQKNDRCPPPPQALPDRACDVPSCRSDSECERHKRCCYNGCIYACLESVKPPPVLDWLVQPKPRWLGGNGWLLDGPEEVLQAEACSTTEDGDEPLHCPTGYDCHIINPGNPAEGIPNRGQCIKQRGNSDGRNLRPKMYKDYKDYFGTSSNNAVGYKKHHYKHLG